MSVRFGTGAEGGYKCIANLGNKPVTTYQAASRQIAALKKKIPAQVETYNALLRAAGRPVADMVTVSQCLSGTFPWEVTTEMAVKRDLVTAYSAVKRRTEEKKYLSGDARGLLKYLHARSQALCSYTLTSEPSSWPLPGSPARRITYFPIELTPRALAGLRALARSEGARVRAAHVEAECILSRHSDLNAEVAFLRDTRRSNQNGDD